VNSTLPRLLIRITATAAVVLLTIYFVRAFDSRNNGFLGPEHRIVFPDEFTAEIEAETDWASYLDIEDHLADELNNLVNNRELPGPQFNRHLPHSQSNPESFARNWNRSYTIEPTTTPIRGVAVMTHGLTASPYSLLATARLFAAEGYHAVVPRMPGHGFAVGGLRRVDWEDWAAAVRVAVRHARSLAGDELPLVMVGYSNGALLTVNYALNCNDDAATPCPDRLILYSPAIQVSWLGVLASLHRAVSWLGYFETFQWDVILPEVDPFNFTSFPKNAGWEIYQLSRITQDMLEDPERTAKLPPILTFQSLVDDTVSTRAVAETLYRRLPKNGSELVIYDINRYSAALNLMRDAPEDQIAWALDNAPADFSLTILSNRSNDGLEVDLYRLPALATKIEQQPTGLRWPNDVFSLSHIAVPFSAGDPVYGTNRSAQGVSLGAFAPRGEHGVLALAPNYFMRLRYNPFYELQASKIRRVLRELH
jgi:alpha-beta hydrolase superfamily lysophospholipase